MLKKYIETEKVIETKEKLLSLMNEYVEEVRDYSESSIDYHGGRADGMQTAMMFLKNNFDKLLENSFKEQEVSIQSPDSNKITIKDFANRLNCREYRSEMMREEEKEAKDLGFVVVFGYSDDNAEFRGAIEDEVDCFDGGRVFERNGKYIDAVWCEEGYSWIYNTNIKHETFDILEDGEKYCRGIVFEYDSIFDLL